MSNGAHWTVLLSALAVPVIAAAGAYIALVQARTARNKLKLDLFDRRMAVDQAARAALGKITRNSALTPDDQLEYLRGVRTARWLFGSEVFKYFDETLWHTFVDLELYNTQAQGPHGPVRSDAITKRADLLKFLMKQHGVLDEMLEPYLGLRH